MSSCILQLCLMPSSVLNIVVLLQFCSDVRSELIELKVYIRTKNITIHGHQEGVYPDTPITEMPERKLPNALQGSGRAKVRAGQTT